MAPRDATAEVAATLNLCQVCVHKLHGHYAGAWCVCLLQAPVGVCLSWEPTQCARVLSDGKVCGLRGPCPDCGLTLHDVPEGS